MRHRRLTLVLAGGVVLGLIAVPRGQQADLQRPTTDASGRWVFGAKNAQTTPNLSGRWVLNVSRSTLPTFKNGPDDGSMHVSGCCLPKSLVELIDHREPSITIDADGLDIDETGKTHEVHLRETRTTDNADNVNTAAGGKDLHSRSHWEGDSLVTEHSVGISEVRTLAPDGRSQTVALYTGRRSAPPTMIYLMERATDPPPAPRGPEPELRNASTHPMQYYLSLPDGWTPAKRWPVVVAFDGSGKDWLDLAHTFVDARKKLPFILVVPLILTNGGGDLRTHPHYHYSPAVWDAVDTNGKCAFDLEGVAAVLSDVEQTAAAEPRAFVTGFSAGAHLMWAIALQHPERLAGAVTSSGNYVGRCVDDQTISTSPARVTLPILGLGGSSDPGGPVFEKQFNVAKELAVRHGYSNISYRYVPGEHDPHAEAVLKYFTQLRAR